MQAPSSALAAPSSQVSPGSITPSPQAGPPVVEVDDDDAVASVVELGSVVEPVVVIVGSVVVTPVVVTLPVELPVAEPSVAVVGSSEVLPGVTELVIPEVDSVPDPLDPEPVSPPPPLLHPTRPTTVNAASHELHTIL